MFYCRENGNCYPYQMNISLPIPCDSMFRHGVDYVYAYYQDEPDFLADLH